MSDFRGDGAAALEWVASYLERVDGLPVASKVQPGEVRAQLPSAPPHQGEPFTAVLRDLDEIVLPGLIHWNHPRFLGYFATSGSDPGILAELVVAALNVNAMLWTTSPAATEVEELAVDWLRQLLALPEGLHGHIEETASAGTVVAMAAARTLRPGGAVLASEQANFSVEKAARLVGLEYRTVAVDDEFRMRPDALAEELAREAVTAVVPTVG
ncbi:MAG: pyridoxal phosphate-dependent decarboxylase family protein, partial [Gaiellaceae bacterium]